MSLILKSFCVLQRGLKVRTTESMLTTRFVKNFATKRNWGFSESLGQEILDSSKSERDRFCYKLSKESIGAIKGIVRDESPMVLVAQQGGFY